MARRRTTTVGLLLTALAALTGGCATGPQSGPDPAEGSEPAVGFGGADPETGFPEDLGAPLPRGHLPARSPGRLPEDDPRRVLHYMVSDGFSRLAGMPGAATACMQDPSNELCARWAAYAGRLVALAQQAPSDRYVMGQVVYSLVRGERQDVALAVLDACQAVEWWCLALRGFALSESGRALEAEAAFDAALQRMPDEWLCAFTDVSPLTSDAVWAAYEGGSCEARLEGLDRFWTLADPAWSRAGNDRRAEHFNRIMWAALHDDALWRSNGTGSRPGLAHVETHHTRVVRYGMDIHRWDARWGKLCSWPGQFGCTPDPKDSDDVPCFFHMDWPWPCVYESEAQPYHVIPDEAALLDPFRAGPGHWPLTAAEDPESYVPRWGRLVGIDGQVAFFERGDSVAVAAAMDVPLDAAFPAGALPAAALFLWDGSGEPRPAAEAAPSDGRWTFRARAPRGRYVAGMEAATDGVVARHRLGHGLPHDRMSPLRLSDLLLYTPRGPERPDSLAAAAPLMKGGHQWRQGDTLGVFLEVYGPDDATSLPVSVELVEAGGGGLLARLGEALGLTSGGTPLDLRWSASSTGGRAALAFTMDLRNAPAGDYTLRVSVGAPGMAPATVERPVRIEGGRNERVGTTDGSFAVGIRSVARFNASTSSSPTGTARYDGRFAGAHSSACSS